MITDHVWPQSEGEPAKVDPCTRSFSLKLGSYHGLIFCHAICTMYIMFWRKDREEELKISPPHPLGSFTSFQWLGFWKICLKTDQNWRHQNHWKEWNLVKIKSCNLHSSSWYKSWLTKYFCPFYISMADKIKTPFQKKYWDTRKRIWTRWVKKDGKWSSIGVLTRHF